VKKFAIEGADGVYPTVPGLRWPTDRRRRWCICWSSAA